MQELEEFRKVEVGQLKTIINDVAKETVKELKATSPRRKGPQGGQYKKNWAYKKLREDSVRSQVVIYEKKPEYRLTHLLEKGHAKRGGGRVDARPHIKKAEEKAIKSIEGRLKLL